MNSVRDTVGIVRQGADENGFELAAYLYTEVKDQNEPESYQENYQLELRLIAQAFRQFLFYKLEQTLNQRIDVPTLPRVNARTLEARVEFLLFD